MVKETSATESTASQTAATSATSSASSQTPQAPQNAAVPATVDYASVSQVRDLESRLNTRIEKNAGGKTGLLWVVTILALAGAGFAGYTSFQNQQKLTLLQSEASTSQQQVANAMIKIEQSAAAFEAAQQTNNQLLQNYNTLAQNDQAYSRQVNDLINMTQQQAAGFKDVVAKVEAFSERNPNDWLLAESYFMVNNANAKAVYEKDINAAVWMLTKADELLVSIEDAQVIALREAISKDVAALNNIQQVDFRGLGLTLDRAYDNVDQLVLEGYSDPQKRAAAFNQGESNEPSANIQDWKENLLKSANDFASRFVEVRRRDAEAATEFLTPEQDLFLRENIKTRILLAKADLSHGDKANMQSNLNAALGLISTYFDPESAITQSTLKELSTLASSEITIETPQVLSSVSAFSQYAHEHLLGRGVASHD